MVVPRAHRSGVKLEIVVEHVVQPADDLEPCVDRVANCAPPLRRQRSAAGRRADQQRRRLEAQPSATVADDRGVAAQVRQDVANALPGASRIDDRDDFVGRRSE